MKIRRYKNSFSIQFGGNGINGERHMHRIAFHKTSPHIRITTCFNTDNLIKMFGFNQKDISLF